MSWPWPKGQALHVLFLHGQWAARDRKCSADRVVPVPWHLPWSCPGQRTHAHTERSCCGHGKRDSKMTPDIPSRPFWNLPEHNTVHTLQTPPEQMSPRHHRLQKVQSQPGCADFPPPWNELKTAWHSTGAWDANLSVSLWLSLSSLLLLFFLQFLLTTCDTKEAHHLYCVVITVCA